MKILMACVFALSLAMTAYAAVDGGWLLHVPAKAHARRNPLAQDAASIAGGEKLYERNCASCHGDDARGRGSRPSLRSAQVREASDGDLEWLLKNGDMAHGMPSWSRLPEGERWQIVRYLRSLPLD